MIGSGGLRVGAGDGGQGGDEAFDEDEGRPGEPDDFPDAVVDELVPDNIEHDDAEIVRTCRG